MKDLKTYSIKHFFDKDTFTLTYVVWDEETGDAVIIDPVLNYDPNSGAYSFESIDELIFWIQRQNLNVRYVLETHAHADHLTGAHYIRERIPGLKIAIGEHITEVQNVFGDLFNLDKEFDRNGKQFDYLAKEGEDFKAGSIDISVLHTPGHTPACVTYLIGDAAFTGDALFMPDYGVGRCDFPKGSATQLYKSVHGKLFELDERIRVFTGHDYQPNGRELKFESTIGEERNQNIHISQKTEEKDFVKMRTERDKTLKAPRLLLPSIQVNINAGELPAPEENGMSYLKLPLRKKGG